MSDDFERILDECIDRINRGDSLEACLADYPEYASRLESVLVVLTRMQEAYEFTPTDESKRKGRQKLYERLEKKRKPSFWQQITGRRMALVAAFSLVVVLLAVYFGLKPLLFPGELPGDITQATPGATTEPPAEQITVMAAIADPEGNFIFLVSDEENAIGDFHSLSVTIEKVRLFPSGSDGKPVEIVPEITEFDLALLPGEKTQELWRGNVPTGEYDKVVIYTSAVNGVLKETGEHLDIKLPSNKLQISLPFIVNEDTVTSFVYDLTVIKAGNDSKKAKYILKPQAGESGVTNRPVQKNSLEKGNQSEKPADRATPLPVTNKGKSK